APTSSCRAASSARTAVPQTAHMEKTRRARLPRVEPHQPKESLMKIATAQIWVHDQDEALAFYTEKLGFEVRADVTLPEMGNFLGLTGGPAEQEEVSIVLMATPGPPILDAETAEQVKTLMGKGAAGTVFLTTDDVKGDYEELAARGVEFTE